MAIYYRRQTCPSRYSLDNLLNRSAKRSLSRLRIDNFSVQGQRQGVFAVTDRGEASAAESGPSVSADGTLPISGKLDHRVTHRLLSDTMVSHLMSSTFFSAPFTL